MTSVYPDDFDALSAPGASDWMDGSIGGKTHIEYWEEIFAAVRAVQETLGVNPQGDSASVAERLAGAGGGVSLVVKTAVELGTQSAEQVTYTAYAVTGVAARGLVTRMTVTTDQPGEFDVEVRSAASGGTLWLQAIGVTGVSYDMSVPFAFEAGTGDTFHILIRNRALVSRAFTLATLRMEKFA